MRRRRADRVLARVDGIALPVLFAIFGAGLVASGIFPCDAGLGYPPGAPATWPRTATPTGNRHNLAGALVFGSLSIATFVVAVVILFVATGALAARAAADPPIGLTQRLAIGAGWTWMAVFASSY